MKLKLKIWRQKSTQEPGSLKEYTAENVSEDMSFLEMIDTLNQELIKKGEDPIEFDHDCREGICGIVLYGYQWKCSWAAKKYDDLSASYAKL